MFAEDPAPAREVCQGCPIRRHCVVEQLKVEHGAAVENRHGVNGGLTPAQRYSLEKRGNVGCPGCNEPFDPLGHLEGVLVCEDCDIEVHVHPIPDEGDQWQGRHNPLAVRVVTWMLDHIEIDGVMPSATSLARTLSTRPGDVQRVYKALAQEGNLAETEDGYVRCVPPQLGT